MSMNWQRFTTSLRRVARTTPVRQNCYRPRLDRLEDRTVLSPATFTIDPTQSSLSLIGSYFAYNGTNYPIDEQGTGSLTTTYEGTIHADIDKVGHTINFLNDSVTAITADNSGTWQPAVGGGSGSAPANYGGTFVFAGTNLTAIRGLIDGLSTDAPLALGRNGTPGTYSFASTQKMVIKVGSLDYNTLFFGNGTLGLANLSGTNGASAGTLTADGAGNLSLVAPVSLSLFYDIGGGASFTVLVNGSLVASGSFDPSIPSGVGPFTIQAGAGDAQSAGSLGLSDALAPVSGVNSATVDLTLSQVQASGLNQMGALGTYSTGAVASVDAVFQDPLQNGSL
jgi:hypothetical protein